MAHTGSGRNNQYMSRQWWRVLLALFSLALVAGTVIYMARMELDEAGAFGSAGAFIVALVALLASLWHIPKSPATRAARITVKQRARRVLGRLVGVRGAPDGASVKVRMRVDDIGPNANVTGYTQRSIDDE
jgi:hypothetical protein